MQIIVFVQYVDTGIHGDAAQKYEGGKSTLVEIQTEQIEGKEYADIGYGYNEDYSQGLFQRIEQDHDDGVNPGNAENRQNHRQQSIG